MPVIEDDSERFGAFYTKLKYYQGWDTLWRVDQDPDIVVCFDDNPARLILWNLDQTLMGISTNLIGHDQVILVLKPDNPRLENFYLDI